MGKSSTRKNYDSRITGCYLHEGETHFCPACSSQDVSKIGTATLDNEATTDLYRCSSCSNVFNESSPGVENLKDQLKAQTGAESVSITYDSSVSGLSATSLQDALTVDASSIPDTSYELQEMANQIGYMRTEFTDIVRQLTDEIRLLIQKNEELQEKVSDPMQGLRNIVNDFTLE